jgi:hypothetical protein
MQIPMINEYTPPPPPPPPPAQVDREMSIPTDHAGADAAPVFGDDDDALLSVTSEAAYEVSTRHTDRSGPSNRSGSKHSYTSSCYTSQ